jgi:transport and Golgi organization protein 2
MCTVTYIAQPGGNFILTSNRDENAARSPQHLTLTEHGDVPLIFPRDTTAGGSWIAASGNNRVVCLLNGAFVKHKHTPPYKKSRGLMVMEFFTHPSAPGFFEKYDFAGMEPFTLVVVDDGHLYELRWDGQQAHVKPLNASGKYIWSSATLYPPEIKALRNGWFSNWLEGRQDFGLGAIQQFHRTGGAGDTWNGFVMNRHGKVQTVSITNVVKNDAGIEMIYDDLLRQTVKRGEIPLRQPSSSVQ